MKQTLDESRAKAALVFAIKTMDDYGFPIGVITEVLGLSESTIRRHRERLVRRPAREAIPGEVAYARKVVMVRMLKAEFTASEITATLRAAKDTVYRLADQLVIGLAQYPVWYQRLIAGDLVNGNLPMPVRRWNTQRRLRRWRTRGRRYGN